VTYTPADKMNVDQVGYAYAGIDGGTAISAAHRTLPLPSYVEVTSLDTGKTILVRVERRGPMIGDGLVELSPGAIAQLGANPSGKTPVRVRRVNPPEIERASLRRGEHAPDRMETPKSLVAVLLRKLNPGAPTVVPLPGAKPLPNLAAIAAAPKPRAGTPAPRETAAPKPAPTPIVASTGPLASPATAPRGTNIVQVGAFSSKANAEATAAKVGGSVSPSGRLWRVRMGPYVARNDAIAALAKAKAAGYSDARIQRAD
jgi:rare lipoprotein A